MSSSNTARRPSRFRLVLLVGALLIGGAVAVSVLLPNNRIGAAPDKRELVIVARDADAMCPWREPERDLAALFPNARGYEQELVPLSRDRLEILKRLGKGVPLASNALYVHRVRGAKSGGQRLGDIVVRRFAGEFGAVECVTGVDKAGRVVGVRVQRHREPPAVAAFLESERWRGALRGKTADSLFVFGKDLPTPPADARETAGAMARAIRSLLIEKSVADREALSRPTVPASS